MPLCVVIVYGTFDAVCLALAALAQGDVDSALNHDTTDPYAADTDATPASHSIAVTSFIVDETIYIY